MNWRSRALTPLVVLPWILAGCAALGGLGGGVTICNHYKDSPIPAGYDSNGCWTSTDYFARPDEVLPSVDATSPRLRIEASGNAPMGIEGTLFFVRAVSPSGKVKLHREWRWPSVTQQIPPGAYQVTAYARGCDGNCDSLDPPFLSCTADILAEPAMTYVVHYVVDSDGRISCETESVPDHEHQPID